jgi:hypothetical protein
MKPKKMKKKMKKTNSIPFCKMDVAQLKEMQKSMQESLEVMKEQFNPSSERIAAMIKQMGKINSLAVAKDELFVTTSASQGFGYEIWRTNRDFEEPKRVKSKLNGCCGQLDIQSDGENLIDRREHQIPGGCLHSRWQIAPSIRQSGSGWRHRLWQLLQSNEYPRLFQRRCADGRVEYRHDQAIRCQRKIARQHWQGKNQWRLQTCGSRSR